MTTPADAKATEIALEPALAGVPAPAWVEATALAWPPTRDGGCGLTTTTKTGEPLIELRCELFDEIPEKTATAIELYRSQPGGALAPVASFFGDRWYPQPMGADTAPPPQIFIETIYPGGALTGGAASLPQVLRRTPDGRFVDPSEAVEATLPFASLSAYCKDELTRLPTGASCAEATAAQLDGIAPRVAYGGDTQEVAALIAIRLSADARTRFDLAVHVAGHATDERTLDGWQVIREVANATGTLSAFAFRAADSLNRTHLVLHVRAEHNLVRPTSCDWRDSGIHCRRTP